MRGMPRRPSPAMRGCSESGQRPIGSGARSKRRRPLDIYAADGLSVTMMSARVVTVQAYGGGGAGGGASNSYGAAGGGGSGQYLETQVSVQKGDVLSWSLGAGAVGVKATPGPSGGATSVLKNGSVILTAQGGYGGANTGGVDQSANPGGSLYASGGASGQGTTSGGASPGNAGISQNGGTPGAGGSTAGSFAGGGGGGAAGPQSIGGDGGVQISGGGGGAHGRGPGGGGGGASGLAGSGTSPATGTNAAGGTGGNGADGAVFIIDTVAYK